MSTLTRRHGTTLTALVLAAVVVAGCGSSTKSSSSSSSASVEPAAQTTSSAGSSGSNSGFGRATAVYEQYKQTPAPLVLPPLSKKVTPGQSVAILTCPLPACKLTTDAVAAAAKALSWKPSIFVSQFSPESYQKTWNQMLQTHPNSIAAVGLLPNASIAKQLAQAQGSGVKVVIISPNGDPFGANGVDDQINGAPLFSKGGVLAADTIVVDAKGKPASVAMVSDPNQGQLNQSEAPLEAELTKNCSGCSAAKVDINLANPPAQNAQAVISYLQRHPDVTYLYYTVADAALGVPEALASAGLGGKVKIITLTPDLTALDDIKKGTQFATIQDEVITGGWRAIDALARLSVGDPLGPEKNPPGLFRIIDKSNVVPGKVPDSCCVPGSFTKSWNGG
jgi:ABC-type sugar transport system substrate-binding protein